MKYFRISARAHFRAYTRIGVLGSALLVMLWIGISASSPGGGVTAAPELATARPPVQAPIVVTAAAQAGSPARAAAPSESAADALPDFCVPDAYEPDDNYDQAKPLTMNGVAQIHGFHFAGDKDYYVVNGLVVGQWYDATTSHLVNEADTYMVVTRREPQPCLGRERKYQERRCGSRVPSATRATPRLCVRDPLARHLPRTLLHVGADAGVPSRRLTEPLSRL